MEEKGFHLSCKLPGAKQLSMRSPEVRGKLIDNCFAEGKLTAKGKPFVIMLRPAMFHQHKLQTVFYSQATDAAVQYYKT